MADKLELFMLEDTELNPTIEITESTVMLCPEPLDGLSDVEMESIVFALGRESYRIRQHRQAQAASSKQVDNLRPRNRKAPVPIRAISSVETTRARRRRETPRKIVAM